MLHLKRWIFWVGFPLILGIIVLQGNHMLKTNPKMARRLGRPMPVRTVSVEQTQLTEILGGRGEVQPTTLINLTTKIVANVKAVNVDVGDPVTAGQVLIQFDSILMDAALATAKSTLRQAAGERERSRNYLKRVKVIYKQRLISKLDLEKAYDVMERATANYMEAKEKLVRAEDGLRNARIVAPVPGIVMERMVSPGEAVSVNQKLLTLGQINEVFVEVKIPEERIGDVYPGQKAITTFSAFPNDLLNGEVVKVRPVTDPEEKTFLAYVKLSNPNWKLTPGLTGFVRIKKEYTVLAVPNVSIIAPTGMSESSLFIVGKDSIARLKKVKVGIISGGMAQILDGLQEGDQVVVVGQLNLKEGDRVRIGDEFNKREARVPQRRITS